jgi:hypothetical protein
MKTVKNDEKVLKYCSNILQNNYFIILPAIKAYEEAKKESYEYSI